jgi:hypothetical protein
MELLLVFMEGVREEGGRERGEGVVFCEGSCVYKEGHLTL